MEGLCARATLIACLALAGTPAAAQRLFCTEPEVLRDPSGAPIHLGRDSGRLSAFAAPAGMLPRLVYRKRRPGREPAHELHVLEGGRPLTFGTDRDRAAVLPASVLAGFAAPWIEDLELDGRWLLVAVSDGRAASQLLARAPAQVVLVELAPGAHVASVHVLASYWSDGTQVPRVNQVRIDREPDPAADGPLVSWSVTHDASRLGADDDVYYCRVAPGGPPSAPQRAFAFDAGGWYGLQRHVVTEAGGHRASPTLLLSARTAAHATADVGIFAAVATRGSALPWLDSPGQDELLDHYRQIVYHLAPGRGGGVRLHATRDADGRRETLWVDDDGRPGDDAAFALTRQPGYRRAAWPDGPADRVYGMFERHGDKVFARPRGTIGRAFADSEVLLFEGTQAPMPLRELMPYPEGLCVFAQAIAQNLCVVTVLPDPEQARFDYADFVDANGDALAFRFHCAL